MTELETTGVRFGSRWSRISAVLLLALAIGIPAAAVSYAAPAILNHNSTDMSSTKWPQGWGIAGGKYGVFVCATCHIPDSSNIKLIQPTITVLGNFSSTGTNNVAVTFENVTSFGHDNRTPNTSSTNICEACHSRTKHHNYNATRNALFGGDLTHNNGADCAASCHLHSNGFKPVGCTGCHGGDAASAVPITTDRHTSHMNNAAVLGTNFGCVECHAKTVSGDTTVSNIANHKNGFVDYSGARAGGSAAYSSATGVCSATYCHTDGKGIQKMVAANNWRSGATLDCKGCHGSDPNAGSTASSYGEPNYSNAGPGVLRSNSHKTTNNKHITAVTDCGNCHAQTTSTGVSITGTAHLNATINPVAGNGKTFTWTAGSLTCSNISCHSLSGVFTAASVQWGAPASCTNCHGGDASSTSPIALGKHTAHTNNAAILGTNFGCIECHAKTVSGNTTISNSANHLNGFADFSGAKTGKSTSYTSSTGVCSATYCHTDGKGLQKMVAANNWNSSATLDCKGCHGSDPNAGSFSSQFGEPNYSNAGSGQPRANSHKTTNNQHVTAVTSCVNCHAQTTSTGTSITGTAHLNATINPVAGNNKAFTWTAGTLTCSNISCHSYGSVFTAPSVSWGTAGSCTLCHGNDAASASPMTLGKHTAHTNPTVNVSLGFALGCVECHAKTVSSNTTISNAANHMNGFADFSGAKTGKSTSYTSSTGVCSATYCHTDGKGLQKMVAANNWNSSATLDCKGCHGSDPNAGSFTSQFGEPNYSNAGSGQPRANSHRTTNNQHVTAVTACGNCHAQTTTTGTSITGTAHLNATINPVAGNGKSFTYTAATKTCSNISCHALSGVFTSNNVQWGTPASCTICHGNNATSGSPMTLGKHTAHTNNAAILGANFGCVECHAKTVSNDSTISNTANHMNGFADFSGAKTGKSTSYTSSTGVCSATYCHTDGKGLQKMIAANNWNSSATLDCKGCHGSDPNAGSFSSQFGEPNYSNAGSGQPRANSHRTTNNQHVTAVASCVNCHAQTTSTGTSITGTAHLNATINPVAGNNKAFTWTAGTLTCSNISCHSYGSVFTAPSVGWGTAGSCTLCHGNDASSSSPMTLGKHTAHTNTVANVSLGFALGCVECHAKTVTNNTTIGNVANHANGFADFSGAKTGKSTSYTSSTGVCSATYCHTDGKGLQKMVAANNWNSSATLDCKGCHGSDPNAGSFSSQFGEPNYSNAGSGQPRANSHRTTNNQHVTAVTSCGNCHAQTSTTGTSITGTSHLNATINPVAGNGKAFTWTSGTKTCSNISCHALSGVFTSNNVQWGTPASCTICHGGNATSGAPMTLGKHAAHTNNAAALGTNFGCIECHAKTVSSDTTIGIPANHMNGFVDFSGARTGKSTSYATSTGVCSATYCHTDGKGLQKMVAANNWKSSATLTCTGCHGSDPNAGSFTSQYGEPNYSNAGSGVLRSNTHQKHVGANAATVCGSCHSQTTTTGTSITGSSHLNATINPVAGNGNTFTWTGGTKTCSTISCHGSNSAVWGASLNCQDCHGNGTSASSSDYQLTAPYFWNNGVMSKIKTAGTNTGWASRGHGRAFGNYSNSGNPAANFGAETKMCEFCHDSTVNHNLSSNPFRLKNYSTAGWGRNGICQSCHATGSAGITVGSTTKNRTTSPTISSDHNGAKHTTSLSGGQFCWDCHNPHGDSNVYMIRDKAAQVSDRVTSAPSTQAATTVVFHNATTGTDFAKSASPYNGICNVCHTAGQVGHYSATSGDGHNSTSNCTWCHKHNGTTGSTAFGASGDCTSCHATAQGARRAITPELGSGSTYKAHHVTGVAITKWQCILCHAEGDWSTGGTSSLHTGLSGQPIYLRNVDSPAAAGTTGTAGTNYWAISASWTNTDYTNLDTFCMKCHDAGGAAGLAVNTTTTGLTLNPGAGSAQALNPYNDTLTNGYDQVARTRQTDVDTQFTGTNASHHAVKGQRYTVSTYLYTAGKFNTFNTLNGTQVKDTSTLHCHDCHYRNGHGTVNGEYMLQNNAGADALASAAGQAVCLKCHLSSYDNNTAHTAGSKSDFAYSAGLTGLTNRTASNGNITGIACVNCHNVGSTGWGGIHGGNNTYVDGTGTTQTTYRFEPGMAGAKYEPAGWTTTGVTVTCYTAANASWTGCNQHSSGKTATSPRPARPLQY
jgi:predicted CxxxxCH...CXXCH cytochrome family protein